MDCNFKLAVFAFRMWSLWVSGISLKSIFGLQVEHAWFRSHNVDSTLMFQPAVWDLGLSSLIQALLYIKLSLPEAF